MEGKLLQGCINQDRSSQNHLYNLYYPYIITVTLHYIPNRAVAEEIVHNAFVNIFREIGTYDPSKKFKPWVRKIVVNASIDHLRKQKKLFKGMRVGLDTFKFEEASDPVVLPNLEKEDHLKIIALLAPSYRLVFNLHVLEGYNHKQIAKKLGIAVGTSKSNLAIARKQLKTIVKEHFSLQELKRYGY